MGWGWEEGRRNTGFFGWFLFFKAIENSLFFIKLHRSMRVKIGDKEQLKGNCEKKLEKHFGKEK